MTKEDNQSIKTLLKNYLHLLESDKENRKEYYTNYVDKKAVEINKLIRRLNE